MACRPGRVVTPTPDGALGFEDPAALAEWLDANHATAAELWVRIFKKGSGRPSVTWTDCVVEALRFGWIDGQKQAGDEASYLQRLTPRRTRSNWSTKNREHAERLVAEGRMTAAGLAEVEAARADGRWETTYDGSRTMEMPPDFLDVLGERPEAKAFFDTLDRRNLYAIYYRLVTARRADTRSRRIAQIADQLERRERWH